MYFLMGIMLIVGGIIMLVGPEVVYEFTQSWKSYGGSEPSTLYIIGTRIVGGFLVILGVLGMIFL